MTVIALMMVAINPSAAQAVVPMGVSSTTLATYASGVTALSTTQKAQIRRALDANPVASKFICTGIRYQSDPVSVNIQVRARAKAACAYAKQLRPELSTFYQNKPTAARSYAGKVLLTIKTPAFPDTALSLDNLDIDWVARSAVSEVIKYQQLQPVVDPKRTVVKGPTAPQKFIDEQLSLLDRAVQLFGSQFSSDYTVVFFSEKDGEWADAKLAELGGNLPGTTIAKQLQLNAADTSCTFGFASSDKNGNPIYYSCVNTKMIKSVATDHLAIHEYFHLVQNSLYKTTDSFMPLWVNEGAPTFFGFALGYGLKDRSGSNGEKFYGFAPLFDPNNAGVVDATRINTFLKSATTKQVVDLYLAMEKDPVNRDAYNQYGMGAIAVQALVASFGVESYFDFLKLTSQMKWQDAFKQTYGLTTIEFYEKLVPYIHALGKNYY
jgi:hypothetical protein